MNSWKERKRERRKGRVNTVRERKNWWRKKGYQKKRTRKVGNNWKRREAMEAWTKKGRSKRKQGRKRIDSQGFALCSLGNVLL